MGKRMTVRRELKKRLSLSRNDLNYSRRSSWIDDDMFSIYGYPSGHNAESVKRRTEQYEKNLENDIDQIEFILWCLDNRTTLDSRRKLILEKETK
jgi:hypothetical protein